jgi:hypothetical protein
MHVSCMPLTDDLNEPRGGLAARASTLFSRAHTSLVLWQKETERRSGTSSTVRELTATIVRILHLPPTASISKPVIVLCQIHESTSYAYAPNQLYKTIFSLPQTSLDRVQPGSTIRIFHPWHELSLTTSSSTLHRRTPLPLPSSTPDLPVNDRTALFCTRFNL